MRTRYVVGLTAILASLSWLPAAALAQQTGGLPDLDARVAALENRVAALESQLAALQSLSDLAPFVSVDTSTLNGLQGPHVIFRGVNVHVQNGNNQTAGIPNGRGNLVIGYDETPGNVTNANRGGSHNVVIGPEHQFSSVGGLVAGFRNAVTGGFASVSGGHFNTASGSMASVSGGSTNLASGPLASVSGGAGNTASGVIASVSGGSFNTASGFASSVSGGSSRSATQTSDWAAGSLLEDF